MIRVIVDKLANKYGFDADEAMEVLKAEVSDSDSSDKIAVCKKNIDLWQKKLAEGKVKDEDKQREKIEKEQKKLEKLESKLKPAPAIKPKKEETKTDDESKPKPKAKKEEPKPKAKEEPKEKPKPKAKEEPKEKRIKRFSPVMVTQLTAALSAVKVSMSDKLKKEFQQYIEDLADDDFRKEGLADHMRAFAKLNEPKSDDKVVDVTLKELQDIETTSTVEPPGTYWDADSGRFVKGPEAEDDEDFEDTTFDGMKYVVGQKTGRVYEARDSGDVFAGFFGVGKFKKMTK